MGKTQKSIAGILSIVVLVMMFQVCPSYAATATYSISKSKLNMTVGDTSVLRVSGTREKISWSSSKKSVATVDQNGKVTATKRGSGSAVITCTVTDQYGNVVKDTCTVNVSLTFGQKIIVYVLFGWIWY